MSKSRSKRHITKQIRQALNRSLDFFKRAGGRRMAGIGYGTGLQSKNLRDATKDNAE